MKTALPSIVGAAAATAASILLGACLPAHSAPDRDPESSTALRDMPNLKWTERAPGVWSALIGTAEPITYLDYAAAQPRTNSLDRMPRAEFPLREEAIRGLVRDHRAQVRIPLTPDERLYGLGLQFKGMNRRGKVYHLRTDHYRDGTERLHAPTPFYISSKGYGLLFNSPRFISIYTGIGNRKDSPNLPPIRDRNTDPRWQAQPTSDAVEASVRADGMEILLFAGPTMLDALRRHTLFLGGGALPPKWGLGFWHRMRTGADQEEVLAEIDEFARRDFPLDVIGLEPGWQSKAYPGTFEWNPTLFPNPARFMSQATARQVRVNLWENPYVSPDAGIYPKMLPLSGSHLVWLGIVPDYTLVEARTVLADQHGREHLALGVSGYKIDEVDGYDFWLWPDHALFPSGTSAEVMRQTYGLQLQQVLFGMFRDRNQRTYSLIRGSNAGASGYPFAIYTDHYEHRGFVTALVNSAIAGVLYTPEIRSAGSAEEWLRRMQTVCFSHMIQLNGWASNTKPWSFPEVEDEVRDIIKLRLRLTPYTYSAFARYHFEGVPPIRPMILEPGYLDAADVQKGSLTEDNPYAMAVRRDVTDQYMFGDCILVAPIFVGETARTVILPQGRWYDFHTGKFVGGGDVIRIEPPLDQIPLFVRDGGIVPMIEAPNRIGTLTRPTQVELRHYGESPGTATLYDDDGTSFDYERGDYAWLNLRVARNAEGKLQGSVSRREGTFHHGYGPFRWRFMTAAP